MHLQSDLMSLQPKQTRNERPVEITDRQKGLRKIGLTLREGYEASRRNQTVKKQLDVNHSVN
uniref:Uncharacterized protein n=1 Tax=Anguilla anguilla TaxID=7936 RepID=A0A0E9XHZ9_ANGAN